MSAYTRFCRSLVVIGFCLVSTLVLDAQDYTGRLARTVLEAFNRAFPSQVEDIAWIDGDWTIVVSGQRFYWAEGRLLPAANRADWASFPPYALYPYPPAVYGPDTYTPERLAALRLYSLDAVRWNDKDNHNAFPAALYGGANRLAVEQAIRKTAFLGKSVNVNQLILEPLARVEARLQQAALESPALAAALADLGSISGYHWRDIRGTQRRSLHAWGMAIDILPNILGNQTIYWNWEKVWDDNWMLVPLDKRWSPPAALIEAFEQEGFVWGGKWDFYDNMHFEYRPELFELSRMTAFREGWHEIYASDYWSGEALADQD